MRKLIIRTIVFVGSLFLTLPIQAVTEDSWIGLRTSRASWEAAVFNEIDKIRQANLQDAALFAGTLLATPNDFFDYGSERYALPLYEVTINLAAGKSRPIITLGYGSTVSGLSSSGLSYINSQTFNIVQESTTNEYHLFQSSKLKHITFDYDQEYFAFETGNRYLDALGFMYGINITRDEFNGSRINLGTAVIASGTFGSLGSPTQSDILSLGNTESNLTSADVQLGLTYRLEVSTEFGLEAGAQFGGGQGESNVILKTFSIVTLGSSSFPFESSSEYKSKGSVRTSRFYLGATYRLSESIAIHGRYSVANLYYTPSSGTVKAGGLVQIENPASGPFYTQKDKLSSVGVEFQFRF